MLVRPQWALVALVLCCAPGKGCGTRALVVCIRQEA